MDLAPGPQEQVNLARYFVCALKAPRRAATDGPSLSLENVAVAYNSFADVPAYGLPHIDTFLNRAAAQAAMERLETRLLELFAGKAV